MDAVLNKVTKTVHKTGRGRSALEAACGATNTLERNQLRRTTVSEAVSRSSADKCGRCFEDAGGY